MDKTALRKKYGDLRKDFIGDRRAEAETKVASFVLDLPIFKKAQAVMFFVSYQSEIDTIRLIKSALALGKRVFVPFCMPNSDDMIACEIDDFDELVIGKHGILAPSFPEENQADLTELEVIFVPALAFDESGYRLGYGCGYYDKFLEYVPNETVTVGLGFSFQVAKHLPFEAHDKKLSMLITEKTIMSF
jgi:5,10-methenyltetrahydrofolate synthetase